MDSPSAVALTPGDDSTDGALAAARVAARVVRDASRGRRAQQAARLVQLVWCRRARSWRDGAPDDDWLITLPPSLGFGLSIGYKLLNRLGVGVLVGPQFKINDGNTTYRVYGPHTR